MKKRLTWIVIGCICIGLVGYGVTGFFDSPASAEVSKETKGNFVRIEDGAKKIVISADGKETAYTLSSTAWVYRNMQKSTLAELQPGDTLDLILNSKEQAAYIKAASPQSAAVQPQDTAQGIAQGAAAEQAAGTAATPAAVLPEGQSSGTDGITGAAEYGPQVPLAAGGNAAANAMPGASASSSRSKGLASASADSFQSASSYPGNRSVSKLSLEWKSGELQLRIKLDPSADGKSSELYIRTKDRTVVYLNGASAEAFIQMLLKELPAEQPAFEQALKQKIAREFQVNDAKPEWKLDVQWKEAAPAASAGKAKGYQKENNGDNGNSKAKNNGNGNGYDKDDDHDDEDDDKDKSKDKDRDKYKDDEKGKEGR